ncbi:MAG: class II aldolase/adducin family protein [Lachnospiraceae bacterium]|nr:class II aldolase/adducin family protein [Lachnospiraceae bacterium]
MAEKKETKKLRESDAEQLLKQKVSGSEAERLLKQKVAVIRVTHMLAERGLLVRTWGSVSRRSDRDHFIITPSGIAYQDLKPERIVRVNLKRLSYRGKLAPSSEMAMHAAIYQLRGEDAGFVIHTHQPYASCVSALGEEEIFHPHEQLEKMEEITSLPVVPYAPPGTKALAEQVSDTISRNPYCQGVLLSHHGLVCWGRNEKQARTRAESIEILCYSYLADACLTSLQYGIREKFSSERGEEEDEIRYLDPETPERIREIHRYIYAKRPDVNAIIHTASEAEKIVSRRYQVLYPLFDDFAQIIGPEVRIFGNERESNGAALNVKKNVNVVFTPGDGAFCLGENRREAEAAALIVNKDCIAQIAQTRNGKDQALPYRHCVRMNRQYKKDYSALMERYALREEE